MRRELGRLLELWEFAPQRYAEQLRVHNTPVTRRSPVCGVSRSPGTCGKHPVNALRAYTGLLAESV